MSLATEKDIKTFILDTANNPYPFPSNCFDAVFPGEVLEHLTDPKHLFEEVCLCFYGLRGFYARKKTRSHAAEKTERGSDSA